MDILRDNLINDIFLVQKLADKMEKDNRSLRDLEQFLKISKSTLQNILKGDGMNMKTNQLIKILYYLDIDLKELIHESTQEKLEQEITERYRSIIF